MNVEIITIGDELLIGQVVDTNSAWLGGALNDFGFNVAKISSISDSGEQIKSTLSGSMSRVDIVLITGGLGPTKDDITKKTLCDFFSCKLIFNSDVFEDVKSFLNSEEQDINNLNRDQAMVPDCSKVIRNSVGTAPIMWFETGGKVVVSMPGIPSEMKMTMGRDVLPMLKSKFTTDDIVHRTFMVNGIPESDLALMIEDWEDSLPDFLKLAYLPAPNRVRLRITGRGLSKDEMLSEIESRIPELKDIIGDALWALSDELPEVLVGKKLIESGATISCAESCTGGDIASKLTKHSGSSAFFKGGVVSYSNEIKEGVLGVSATDLEKYGAVSRQVVEQMALGVKKLMATDFAVATSGVAGPTGGSKDKPVGTVWIAWAGPDGVKSKRFQFGNIRQKNIISSTEAALIGLLHT